VLAGLISTLFDTGIVFYKLLNIDIGYQPLNLFIQSEALFPIVLLVLEEHKEFPKCASVGNYLHRQGIMDKIFTHYKDKNFSDSGVERSREPLKIYRASILEHANS
jgi:hypothetical protein